MVSRNLIEKIISIIAISLCAYLFYATTFGPYKTTMVHRAIFLAMMLIIFFGSSKPLGQGRWALGVDWFIIALSTFSLGYMVVFWEEIISAVGATYLSRLQILVGFIIILVVLEGVRRMNFVLFILALSGIGYTLYGNYLPGILGHPGMDFDRFVYLTAYSHEGIFGLGTAVAATYLFMFMLFSTALQETGAGEFFMKFANAFVGRTRGGPAKCAVVASGLTGTMMGSSIGNVVTVGTFTIPMMKKMGFKPDTAAAIEVLSSEGAQLMPPVMGVGAFMMAELTGIPYATIALAAVIPAVLYYVSAYVVVDMESAKLGLKGMPNVERFITILSQGVQFFIPIAVLFYLLLVSGFTATYSGLLSVLLVIAISQVRKNTRISGKKVIKIFDKGTRVSAEMTAMIATLGIIQQAFIVTGLGPRMSDILVTMAGQNPTSVLVMSMVISIILGMGMPTPIAYLLTAVFVAPALVEVGFPLLGAHLFLFYFAIKSGSTPPVAVVAVVAAAIAESDWWKTGWRAFWYSLPGFFVAYAFVFKPAYLLQGTPMAIAITFVCGLIGTAGIAVAIQRYLFLKMKFWEIILLAASSLSLTFLYYPWMGLLIMVIPILSQWLKVRALKEKA
jgi:TRAP transporter 4TM/12TM fusion protein